MCRMYMYCSCTCLNRVHTVGVEAITEKALVILLLDRVTVAPSCAAFIEEMCFSHFLPPTCVQIVYRMSLGLYSYLFCLLSHRCDN